MKLTWLPNAISLLRLALVVLYVRLFFVPIGVAYLIFPLAVLIIFTDLVDGILARMLNAHSPLGSVLDTFADISFIAASFILFYLAQAYTFFVLFIIAMPRLIMGIFLILFLLSKKAWNTGHLIGDKIAGAAYYLAIIVLFIDPYGSLSVVFWLMIVAHYCGTFLSLKSRFR